MSVLSDWFYSELDNLINRFSTNVQVVYVAGGTLGTMGSSTAAEGMTWDSVVSNAGNAVAKEMIPADPQRESLLIYNNSDVAIYVSIGDNFAAAATTRGSYYILPHQTLPLSGLEAKAAIYADAGAGGKEMCLTFGGL